MLLALLLIAAGPDAPLGMVRVPAGSFVMGRSTSNKVDETPAHQVSIDAFYLDETLVTVAAFRAFVEATRYVSTAERLGYGKTAFVGMKDWAWKKVPGATWRAPFGKDGPAPKDDHPVVMVSWIDASAYCRHLERRLPTEAEWEYAMRAGKSGVRFPWGNTPEVDGKARLNYWEGSSHLTNPASDGHVYFSPVRAFPPNDFGLYDPVGNVWQWTADWYAPDTYQTDRAGAHDPSGPEAGTHKVARGGSWWCSKSACSGHGLYARGKTLPEAVFSNNGFRCARSLDAP
jgi:formylglycine-generating enzyme